MSTKWEINVLSYIMQISLLQNLHSLPGGLMNLWVPWGLVISWVPQGGMKILKIASFIKESSKNESENEYIVIIYSNEGNMIVFIR